MQDPNLKSTRLSDAGAAICKMDPEITDILHLLITRSAPGDHAEACGKVSKNVFESPSAKDFDALLKFLPKPVKNLQTPDATMLDGHLPCSAYTPIRHFRSDGASLWGAVEKLRIFLSSGTTSGLERRSRSVFSHKGLLFYKAGSIAAYLSALESRAPSFSANYLNSPVFSFVPPTSEWPDSSLAQMIEWFAQYWKTTYLTAENLDSVRRALSQVSHLDQPVIVWGTAFHFVNLFDGNSSQMKLPKGSIVVETGGTKGKTRSVTREELYQMISEGFGIQTSDIVSEYGMCELASQAWDVAESENKSLYERKFRFPWWVQVAVMSKPNKAEGSGIGALTIYDPLRVDLGGTAIQTEDLAKVYENSEFSLLGRVPTAPLKGCSLNVENLAERSQLAQKTNSKPAKDFYKTSDNDLPSRASRVQAWLSELLSDGHALKRLALEFGDLATAQKTVANLRGGLPAEPQGFVDAAMQSIRPTNTSKNWLMIPPSSHSVALIYPLACALTLGLSLRVRLTSVAGTPADETFLARAIQLAKSHGFIVNTLSEAWKLGPHDLLDGESVLVFGDDDTSKFMRRFCGGRASIFGNVISMSLVTKDDFDDKRILNQLAEDLFSLGQRGCLSSRLVISIGGNSSNIKDKLIKKFPFTPRDENPIGKTARSMEITRLRELGFDVLDQIDGLTIALKEVDIKALSQTAEESVSRLDFVAPVLLVPEITDKTLLIDHLLKISSLKSLSLSETAEQSLSKTETYRNLVKDVQLVRLGSLGAPRLDGHHLGRQFFGT